MISATKSTTFCENIEGILLHYDSNWGTLLLRRRSDPPLKEFYARFASSRTDKGFWFARFKWNAIKRHQRELLRQHDENGNGLRLAVGSPVRCTLQRVEKWEATEILVDFRSEPFDLPKRWRRTRSRLIRSQGSRRKAATARPRRRGTRLSHSERRQQRSNYTRRSNIYRPWRG